MSDFEAILVCGSDFNELSRSLTMAIQTLPPDLGKRLAEIREDYFSGYGFAEAYAHLNNRTVGQIFAEYKSPPSNLVTEGEVEGVKFRLYDPARSSSSDQTHTH